MRPPTTRAQCSRPDSGIDMQRLQGEVDYTLRWLGDMLDSCTRSRSAVALTDAINAVRQLDRILTGRDHGPPITHVAQRRGQDD